MRIGLVTAEYPPDQGGVGDFSRELTIALRDLGHEAHVITTTPQAALPTDMAGVPVHRVVTNWGWGCWRQVRTHAERLNLEIINVQYQAAAYSMHPAINLVPRRGLRAPVVATFHDLKVPYLFPKAGPLRWRVVRALAQRADGVIVTNRQDDERLRDRLPVEKMALIPIGSNIPAAPPPGYQRDAERARWQITPDDFLLGYFGFLNESKGGEELVRALALVKRMGLPAHLLMIGGRAGSSDPTNLAYAEKVDSLIQELGVHDRVHWTGYTDPAAVSAGLLATDVCVLPYRDGVSFRRGTLHACLAHGLAVVTTRPAVPLPEVRDGENMLLAERRDARDLARKVALLAKDPALRARLRIGASTLGKEFSWESIARQTAAFFEERMGELTPG